MFYVIQKVYNAEGVQIDSDSIAEFKTESEANAYADLQYEPCRLGKDKNGSPVVVFDDGNYATYHVEAE